VYLTCGHPISFVNTIVSPFLNFSATCELKQDAHLASLALCLTYIND